MSGKLEEKLSLYGRMMDHKECLELMGRELEALSSKPVQIYQLPSISDVFDDGDIAKIMASYAKTILVDNGDGK